MIYPDSRCEIHGDPMRLWISKDKSRTQSYCLQCRYEREDQNRIKAGLQPRFRYFGTKCRRGHLKTRQTWKYHKEIGYYCNECHNELRRIKKAERKAREAENEVAA